MVGDFNENIHAWLRRAVWSVTSLPAYYALKAQLDVVRLNFKQALEFKSVCVLKFGYIILNNALYL